MRKYLFFLLALPLAAESLPVAISQAYLVGGVVADNAMSYNQYEGNPVFRRPDGRYDMRKGLAYDIPLTAGVVLAGWWLERKHPKWKWAIAAVNIAAGSARYDAAFRGR